MDRSKEVLAAEIHVFRGLSACPGDSGGWLIGEATGERTSGACTGVISVASRWDKEVLLQVVRERAKNRVGLAVLVAGCEQMLVKTRDSSADGPDGALGAVL